MSGKSKPSSQKGYKSKHTTPLATPSTSSAKLHLEFKPVDKKSSKTELSCTRLEDEEFPRGYTLLDSMSGTIKDLNKDSPFSSELSSGFGELSLVAEYDEVMRKIDEYADSDLLVSFIAFAEHQELCRLEWLKAVKECRRLQSELDKANHEIGDFQSKLRNARRLLDQEKKLRRKVEEERNMFEQQIITRDRQSGENEWRLYDDSKERFSVLNNNIVKSNSMLDRNIASLGTRLDTICEINSTASLLSDMSYSRSDGEFDTSTVLKVKSEEWKKPNTVKKEYKSPKRFTTVASSNHKIVEINPTDKIVATTTLSMSKEGPITATSVIEAVPQTDSETSFHDIEIPSESTSVTPKSKEQLVSSASSSVRGHNFISKTVFSPDTCAVCQSRIRFGKLVVKCKDCKAVCHAECKPNLPMPCIPHMNTPTKKVIGTLSDYAPNTPPMVPAILIYCINEIELRGMREIGLYRIPGVEKDVKTIKEKILHCKSIPDLNNIDVHVLCGVVKDFLRNLKEPLVTYSLRKEFVQASAATDEVDVLSCMYQTISQLPQANRDTLAYIMLHLNRVAASKDCKMPSSNLSKIFGPTLIGYSSGNPETKNLLLETKQTNWVMEYFMKIPMDFWSSFINVDSRVNTPKSKMSTPSTGSTSRAYRRKFFTPDDNGSASSNRKRKKYFGTPPSGKN